MALKNTFGRDQGRVERVSCHFLYMCMLSEAEVASGRRKEAFERAVIGSNQGTSVHLPRAATFEVFWLGPLRSKCRCLYSLPYTVSLCALSRGESGIQLCAKYLKGVYLCHLLDVPLKARRGERWGGWGGREQEKEEEEKEKDAGHKKRTKRSNRRRRMGKRPESVRRPGGSKSQCQMSCQGWRLWLLGTLESIVCLFCLFCSVSFM